MLQSTLKTFLVSFLLSCSFILLGCEQSEDLEEPFYFLQVDSSDAQVLSYSPYPEQVTAEGQLPSEMFIERQGVLVFFVVETDEWQPTATVSLESPIGKPLPFQLSKPMCNSIVIGRDSDGELVLDEPYIFESISFVWKIRDEASSDPGRERMNGTSESCLDSKSSELALRVFVSPDTAPLDIEIPLKLKRDGFYVHKNIKFPF